MERSHHTTETKASHTIAVHKTYIDLPFCCRVTGLGYPKSEQEKAGEMVGGGLGFTGGNQNFSRTKGRRVITGQIRKKKKERVRRGSARRPT